MITIKTHFYESSCHLNVFDGLGAGISIRCNMTDSEGGGSFPVVHCAVMFLQRTISDLHVLFPGHLPPLSPQIVEVSPAAQDTPWHRWYSSPDFRIPLKPKLIQKRLLSFSPLSLSLSCLLVFLSP